MRYPEGMRVLSALLLFAGLCVGLSVGCSPRAQWHHPSRPQADLPRDLQECEVIAKEFARQASLTGEREDPATRINTLNACLYSRGWSDLPRGDEGQGVGQASPPAFYAQGKVTGFGQEIKIPPGFALLSVSTAPSGPTITRTFSFERDDTHMKLLFQEAFRGAFEEMEYPVVEPFFLYHRGQRSRKTPLDWAVFAGEIQNAWVIGYGAYLRVNRKERVTLVITRPLPNPEEAPPVPLRLSQEQYHAAELFKEEWSSWAEANISADRRPVHLLDILKY